MNSMSGMDSGSETGSWYNGKYIPTDAEATEYQATREPWAYNVIYGYYGVAFLCVALAAFTVVNFVWKVGIGARFLRYYFLLNEV